MTWLDLYQVHDHGSVQCAAAELLLYTGGPVLEDPMGSWSHLWTRGRKSDLPGLGAPSLAVGKWWQELIW